MKITSIGVVLIILAGCQPEAESVTEVASLKEQALKLQEAALSSDLAWELTESLTTEVGPRVAGSDGDERAQDWAVEKLESLGFDEVWKEPVEFPQWRRGEEQAEILAPFPQPLAITALGGSPGTGREALVARVLEFPTIEALEDIDDGSLQGEIVFVSYRMERFRDGAGYSPAVRARSKGPLIAAEKGASALLIRSVGTDTSRLPHTGAISNDFERPRVPSAALSNPDADLLSRQIARGKPVTVRLRMDTGYVGTGLSHTIVGDMRGTDSPDEIIILGAHLDSWDLGTGAIDDAAGVGIISAAAHLIREQHGETRRTIRVILYANEEQGLWGAKSYASAHADEVSHFVMGGESDFGAGRIYALRVRVQEDTLPFFMDAHEVLEPLGIALDLEAPANGGPDVGELRKAGMAAFDLRQDGTDYFNWHHTADDTLDKIEPAALQQNLAAWVSLVYMLADSDVAPGPVPVEEPKEE